MTSISSTGSTPPSADPIPHFLNKREIERGAIAQALKQSWFPLLEQQREASDILPQFACIADLPSLKTWLTYIERQIPSIVTDDKTQWEHHTRLHLEIVTEVLKRAYPAEDLRNPPELAEIEKDIKDKQTRLSALEVHHLSQMDFRNLNKFLSDSHESLGLHSAFKCLTNLTHLKQIWLPYIEQQIPSLGNEGLEILRLQKCVDIASEVLKRTYPEGASGNPSDLPEIEKDITDKRARLLKVYDQWHQNSPTLNPLRASGVLPPLPPINEEAKAAPLAPTNEEAKAPLPPTNEETLPSSKQPQIPEKVQTRHYTFSPTKILYTGLLLGAVASAFIALKSDNFQTNNGHFWTSLTSCFEKVPSASSSIVTTLGVIGVTTLLMLRRRMALR